MMIEYDDMCSDLLTKDIISCSDDMTCYDYLMHERVERKIEESKVMHERKSGREDKRLAKRVTGRKGRRMIIV